MAEAGIGKVVLPTFVGDAWRGLTRQSEVIEELSHQRWLVCHHETRHEPGIRAALEALSTFLNSLP